MIASNYNPNYVEKYYDEEPTRESHVFLNVTCHYSPFSPLPRVRTDMEDRIRIIEYHPRYALETTRMWRDSKEKALGVKERFSFESQYDFLVNTLVKENSVFLALDTANDKVVGFLALRPGKVGQLYIHVDYQGQGIGSRLLNLTKQMSPEGLRLFTFEANKPAQVFYEKHGFRIIGRGFAEQEQLPDIEYEWPGKGEPET